MMPQEGQVQQDPKSAQMGQLVDQIMMMCQQLKDMMGTEEAPETGGPAMPPSDFAKQLMQQG